jgi:hypothetical protein
LQALTGFQASRGGEGQLARSRCAMPQHRPCLLRTRSPSPLRHTTAPLVGPDVTPFTSIHPLCAGRLCNGACAVGGGHGGETAPAHMPKKGPTGVVCTRCCRRNWQRGARGRHAAQRAVRLQRCPELFMTPPASCPSRCTRGGHGRASTPGRGLDGTLPLSASEFIINHHDQHASCCCCRRRHHIIFHASAQVPKSGHAESKVPLGAHLTRSLGECAEGSVH